MENLFVSIKNTNFWMLINDENKSVDDIIIYTRTKIKKNNDYEKMDKFIDTLDKEFKIDKEIITKQFIISCLMIAKYPNELISKVRNEKEKLVFDKSFEIFEMIKEDKHENFNKKIITFSIVFEDWKNKDKESQLNLLCEMYYRYKNNIDAVATDIDKLEQENELIMNKKDEYVNELKKQLNNILFSMKRLTKNYKEYLNNYKMKNVDYDEKVYKMMYEKLKISYWVNIKKDIFELKNTDVYKHIINDYLNLINNLKVSNLDISLLITLRDYEIESENLLDACYTLVKAFISINKQLDSENYDEIYDMLLDKVINNNGNVVDLYKFCFERLEMIKKIKEELNKDNNYQ